MPAIQENYDVCVVGAGHAGCEAALACARLGLETIIFTVSVDPNGMTSWEFFDYLLENANVVGTPGSGFGPSGETYFRLTAFGSYENTVEAVDRLTKL